MVISSIPLLKSAKVKSESRKGVKLLLRLLWMILGVILFRMCSASIGGQDSNSNEDAHDKVFGYDQVQKLLEDTLH